MQKCSGFFVFWPIPHASPDQGFILFYYLAIIPFMKKFSRKEWLSIPNIMGYFRILLVPVFTILYLRAKTTQDYFIAGMVVLASYITDILDGIVARKCNQVTELGVFIDPLADKLTQLMILVMLLIRNQSLLPLLLLFLAKESFMAIMGLIMYKKGNPLHRAEWFGKLSTGVFDVGMILILLLHGILKPWMEEAIFWICAFFMMLSLVLYIRLYSRMAKHNDRTLQP